MSRFWLTHFLFKGVNTMESNVNGIIYNHKEKRLILSNVDELCCGERNITIGDLLRCLKRYPKDTTIAIRIEDDNELSF